MNACHILDYMGYVVGSDIAEVAACGATLVQPTEVEDTISLSYRYQSGAIGALQATTTLSGPFLFEQRLWGRDGQLTIAPQVRFWSKRTIMGREAGTWHTISRLAPAAERRQFFERFAQAVQEQTPLPVRAEEARAVQAAIEAAYQATRQGCAVAVEHLKPEAHS
jgi:predicted dehydrogenase